MRAFVIVTAFIALAGFAIWQHRTITAQDQRIARMTEELKGFDSPRATPRSQTRRIVCPVCHGERVVVYDSGGNNDPVDRRTENCPVCLARGYREVALMPNQRLCPDCQGMGLVWSRLSGHPMRVANCARCGSTGVITLVK